MNGWVNDSCLETVPSWRQGLALATSVLFCRPLALSSMNVYGMSRWIPESPSSSSPSSHLPLCDPSPSRSRTKDLGTWEKQDFTSGARAGGHTVWSRVDTLRLCHPKAV